KMSNCLTAWSSMFRFTCVPSPRASLSAVDDLAAGLLQSITAIKCVALGGDEAGVGDDAAEFAFVGSVFHSGSKDNVFFNKNAADIVRAELQTDLADFDSGGEPDRFAIRRGRSEEHTSELQSPYD